MWPGVDGSGSAMIVAIEAEWSYFELLIRSVKLDNRIVILETASHSSWVSEINQGGYSCGECWQGLSPSQARLPLCYPTTSSTMSAESIGQRGCGSPCRPCEHLLDYCTITINSAGGGTWDRLAEIWTSATLRVDRGHVWISVKAKVRPLVVCCCVVRVPSQYTL